MALLAELSLRSQTRPLFPAYFQLQLDVSLQKPRGYMAAVCPRCSEAAVLAVLSDCIWLGHRRACLTHCRLLSGHKELDVVVRAILSRPQFLSYLSQAREDLTPKNFRDCKIP